MIADRLRDLRLRLRVALKIEHLTIPPYLCALYSIPDGKNLAAARVIQSVVMEEMLHMVLVANVLNAIGGKPDPSSPDFVPGYPTFVPYTRKAFVVHLGPLSREAIGTFLDVERPDDLRGGPGEEEHPTVYDFYCAIIRELKALCRTANPFRGDPGRQVTAEYYYGGAGRPIPVTDLRSALQALDTILHQGEGLPQSIFEEPVTHRRRPDFASRRHLAHYFRLNEIRCGRYYAAADTPRSGPTGAPFPLDWDAVYPMRLDPRTEDHPRGSEVWALSNEFNRCYMRLLGQISAGFNGEPKRLLESVNLMYDLKHKAVALMRVPDGRGHTAGPSFEYVRV